MPGGRLLWNDLDVTVPIQSLGLLLYGSKQRWARHLQAVYPPLAQHAMHKEQENIGKAATNTAHKVQTSHNGVLPFACPAKSCVRRSLLKPLFLRAGRVSRTISSVCQ